MVTIFPFCALQPAPGLAARVASPPYDVLSTAEARALAKGNNASFLLISRPEIGLPEGTDEHADEVYARGQMALGDFVRRGVLRASEHEAMWLYAQQRGSHRQVGLVACASVLDYDEDRIKKHEKTRTDKEDDRTRHVDSLGANDEPVFLTYYAHELVDRIIDSVTSTETPLEDFASTDGVQHTIWNLPTATSHQLQQLFAQHIATLYVADGHHRSAAASRVHRLRAPAPGTHDRFLAVLFPHNQMQILPYNRVVRDPQQRTPAELLRALHQCFTVVPAPQAEPTEPRTFGLFLGGQWYRATVRPEDIPADLIGSLDVSLCQDLLLNKFFDITNPRVAKNIEFIGGIRGSGELEQRVTKEGWDLGVYLYPTQIEQLLQVSDAGLLMPPKSTWFEPKLRSGLFVHRFEKLHDSLVPRSFSRTLLRHVMNDSTLTQSFAGSDIGRRRQINEDAHLCDDSLGLYIVADGIGGHAAGEVASQEAVETVFGMVKRGLENMPTLAGAPTEERVRAACRLLEGAVQGATYMIFALAELDRTMADMGTTMSALLVLGEFAVVAQVGDSRIYQFRNKLVKQLTEDHTLVAWQVRQGFISEQEAKTSPHRNVITRSVGNRDYVQVDTSVVDVCANDRFLLCSDGLHGYLAPGEIENMQVGPGNEVVQQCLHLANDRGGRDNITVIIVDVKKTKQDS